VIRKVLFHRDFDNQGSALKLQFFWLILSIIAVFCEHDFFRPRRGNAKDGGLGVLYFSRTEAGEISYHDCPQED